ncbi:Rtr1/RPAP2 family-domain-containing protein [Lipomyces oligophaga]|uniref:Rtr1/RPAP2 family-domain-containing protein n=1 Tax=Lipomyces oligophaga TaxID=45792 RepID=UPI0034CFF87F
MTALVRNAPKADSPSLSSFRNSVIKRFITEKTIGIREANSIVLLLIEFMTNHVDSDFLKYASRFLTAESYDDIVDERNVLHICGYPICTESPISLICANKRKRGKKIYQIQYTEPRTSDPPSTSAVSYMRKYCSRRHFQASMIYRAQLSEEAVWARSGITWLPPGESEWEKDISLLDEIMDSKESVSTTGLDRDVREVIAGLRKWKNQATDLNADVERELNAGSISNTKSTEHLDIMQLNISERNPTGSDATKPIEISSNYEGYVIGTAGELQEPEAYKLWKERRKEIHRELGVDQDD